MGTVTHAFTCGIADDAAAQAAGEVLPSHWNAALTLSGIAQTDTINTFAAEQTFTVAPVFTDAAGSRTALGLATVAATGAYSDLTGAPAAGANAALSNLASVAINAPLTTGAGVAAALTATPPAATTGASQAGKTASLTASAAVASTDTAGAAAGGEVTIEGGAAARNTSGNADGGAVRLKPGPGIGTGVVGQVLLDVAGTAARPALAFDIGGNKAYGLWYSGGVISISINGTSAVGFSSGGIALPASCGIVGNASTPGVLYGLKRQPFALASSTTLSSGNYNGGTLTNSTAAAAITSTLVSAAAGWHHRFVDDNATYRWTIKPNTADTIIWTDGTVVTAATGSIVSTARYCSFDVEALDATVWLATNVRGTWTVTA